MVVLKIVSILNADRVLTAKYMLVIPYMMINMLASVSRLKQKYIPAATEG